MELVSTAFNETEKNMLERPQVECPIVNHFGPGVYVREMHVPAGTLLMGHHHKESHLCMLLAGELVVFDGEKTSILIAPAVFMGSPGRKIGYAISAVVFCNLHANPTNETDLVKLADIFTVKSDTFRLDEQKKEALLCRGSQQQ